MAPEELLALARDAAQDAGRLLLQRFRAPATGVTTKGSPTDLVSDADRAAQELLIAAIARARPDDGIVAEEGAERRSGTGLTWVIDPLDGTVNFLFGLDVWAVSVAVEDERGTVAGLVHDPNRDETFAAIRDHGATLNDLPIEVGRRSDLSDALVGTGFAYDARTRRAQAAVVAQVLPVVRDIRRAGSVALDLSNLACGRLDAFYEAHMKPWDKAAGALIVTEAGGTVSELRDPFGDSHGLVAANATLHDALRPLVATL